MILNTIVEFDLCKYGPNLAIISQLFSVTILNEYMIQLSAFLVHYAFGKFEQQAM